MNAPKGYIPTAFGRCLTAPALMLRTTPISVVVARWVSIRIARSAA
jgi:hypothetical protein